MNTKTYQHKKYILWNEVYVPLPNYNCYPH